MATTERQLAAVARRHLPPAVAEQWITLMRPAIRLRSWSGGKKPIGQLGGLPALPEGVAWPEWKDRGSLNFVASFDCGRLPVGQLNLNLPDSGTLLFFYLDPVQDSVEIEVAYTHLAGKVPFGDPALREEAQRWTLLAQIDSDEEADMMWGDVGILYWLIRPEDLAARRFEAASFTRQCT